MPDISVIVTTYNRARLLDRCLASILSQESADFEVIVVDDASTDDTASVMEKRLGDARLRYERVERNCGAPARPRNLGIALAKSPLLFIFDSDDTMLPGCLQAFVSAFAAEPRLGLAWSWKSVLDRNGVTVEIEKRDRLMTEPAFPLALSYAPGANGLGIRRVVVDTIGGFDEAMPRMDDYEFTLRFLDAGRWQLRVLPLVTMNVHSDSNDHVSASERRTLLAREHVLTKHRRLFAAHPEVFARHLYQLALLRLKVHGDRIGFVRGIALSLRNDPRRLRRALTLWRLLPLAVPSGRPSPASSSRRVDLKRNVVD